MNEIQFHFNPLTPIPQPKNMFPWGTVFISLGLLALLFAIVYANSNPYTEEIPEDSDEELPKD